MNTEESIVKSLTDLSGQTVSDCCFRQLGKVPSTPVEPQVLAPNVACLDYSVAAKSGGMLVAYRWDGEQRLDNHKFVLVETGAS